MADLVGTVLGRYRLLERVGSGGMADVYRGVQVGLDREVAVKVLPPVYAKDPERLKRFKREQQATAKLSHPNVVTVYDSGEQDGCHYFVMEYLRSEGLDQVLAREGRLDVARTLRLGGDLLKALAYAHGRNLIHRDLKPSNVKFDGKGNAVLTDFGVAKDLDGTLISLTDVPLGTPDYGSPESLLGAPVDARSDLYQVGVILYEALTGARPVAARNPYARGAEGPGHAPPSVQNPDVPEALDRLVLKALEPDPARRFQGAGEMLDAVARVGRRLEAQRPAPSPGGTTKVVAAPGEEAPAPTPTWLAPAAVVLLVLALALVTVPWSGAPRVLEHAVEARARDAVVSWKTDRPCVAFVRYYASLDARRESPRPSEPALEGRVTLDGLDPGTRYSCTVCVADSPSDPGEPRGAEFDFTTRPELAVRNVVAEASDRRLTVSWTTTLPADTRLRLTSGLQAVEHEATDQAAAVEHTLTVSGLEPDTEYRYRIVAAVADGASEPVVGDERRIRTARAAPAVPPNPLEELLRSYLDKLGRMTPDERDKLREALLRFLGGQGDLPAAFKRAALASSTTTDAFNERFAVARCWIDDLAKRSLRPVDAAREFEPLTFKYEVASKRKACADLDALFRRLAAADPACSTTGAAGR